ncbi:hypothetical protein BLNAU_23179 [Blattamonas nauphoetae]|uniref:Uncharacterized protein n=1 Tax=Blattamonas nauphoetae TaxID=2049346 RepID=A0ABQ9WQZ2_9EUKA|nr:hypothetical protein BLNAU_23179 [Blattamonas nauphoetae]
MEPASFQPPPVESQVQSMERFLEPNTFRTREAAEKVGGLEQTYGILTDADAAMAAAIRAACPTIKHLLCRWQILRNVEAHLRTSFQTSPEREDLTIRIMTQWNKLVEHDDSASFPMAKAAFLNSLDLEAKSNQWGQDVDSVTGKAGSRIEIEKSEEDIKGDNESDDSLDKTSNQAFKDDQDETKPETWKNHCCSGIALFIRPDLDTGKTTACPTFASPPLTASPFRIGYIQMWSLTSELTHIRIVSCLVKQNKKEKRNSSSSWIGRPSKKHKE